MRPEGKNCVAPAPSSHEKLVLLKQADTRSILSESRCIDAGSAVTTGLLVEKYTTVENQNSKFLPVFTVGSYSRTTAIGRFLFATHRDGAVHSSGCSNSDRGWGCTTVLQLPLCGDLLR